MLRVEQRRGSYLIESNSSETPASYNLGRVTNTNWRIRILFHHNAKSHVYSQRNLYNLLKIIYCQEQTQRQP